VDWQSLESRLEKGPVSFFWGLLFTVVPILLVLSLIGVGASWVSESFRVARDEFGATSLLRKYEWFKNAAASLDAKKASIKVYEKRLLSLQAGYGDLPRNKWSREDREQANLWEQEVAGMIAGYNNLAGEYNSAMAKINWRFCNAGDVPAGGIPLPREYRSYLE
jgi:hypothetical protein